MITDTLNHFINTIPKTELHVHIEGTLEPELLFEMARRNNISIRHKSVEALKHAYRFSNLQEFLDIYYEGAKVLLHEQDFYDLTFAYLQKCHKENIVHTELFFDPQTHTQRGVPFETVIAGIQRALTDAFEKWGITSRLIPNFLRHLSEEEAIEMFREALPFRELITGFGLDSSELGHPPAKFKKVFQMVRDEGFVCVAHAGEEGPAQNVSDSLRLLGVSRIDHGVRSVDNKQLLKTLAENKIPLTVCPLSNLKLRVVKEMKDLPLPTLLHNNIIATVNSDDPAYFGGYLNENYRAVAGAFNLSEPDILKLAENSFNASFLSGEEKNKWLWKLRNNGYSVLAEKASQTATKK